MKKILVVDDDKGIGEVITEYLSANENYEVTYTSSGTEALKMLNDIGYDLLITDLLMPEVNGIELTEFVFDNGLPTKVLACSGGGNSGSLVAGMALDQALQEGADNAIMKPFTEEELLTKVKNLLKV